MSETEIKQPPPTASEITKARGMTILTNNNEGRLFVRLIMLEEPPLNGIPFRAFDSYSHKEIKLDDEQITKAYEVLDRDPPIDLKERVKNYKNSFPPPPKQKKPQEQSLSTTS